MHLSLLFKYYRYKRFGTIYIGDKMQKLIRKTICWTIGCNSICLFKRHWGAEDGSEGSMSTGWQCERCGKTKFEQWDT